MEQTNSNNSFLVSRVLNLAYNLDAKFKPIDEERYTNYNMTVARLMWKQKDREKLEREGRPAYSYPMIPRILKIISGIERSSRKKLQVVGRNGDDQDTATIINQVIDWELDANNFDFQKSKAILDALIGRWGFLYQNWSFDGDPEGQMICKRINPFRVRFDTDFTDITFKDCRYMMDSQWLTIEELITKYAFDKPELASEMQKWNEQFVVNDEFKKAGTVSTLWQRMLATVGWSDYKNTSDSYNPSIRNDLLNFYDQLTGRYRVIDLHERRQIRKMNIYSPELNKLIDVTKLVVKEGTMDNEMLSTLRDKHKGVIHPVTSNELWLTTIVPAMQMCVQDMAYPFQNGNFMITVVTASDFHTDILQTQSVVDEMMDSQSAYNKQRSTTLELVTRYATMGFTAEAGAEEGFENEWINRKIGQIKHVKKGFWDKIKPDPVPQIPPTIFQMNDYIEQDFEKFTGVTRATQGMQESSGESGRLFLAKQQQGELALQFQWDNIDTAMLPIGRNAIDLTQKFMTEERIIRIVNDSGDQEYLAVNQKTIDGVKNDLTIGKYDVVISEMPYGRTARQLAYAQTLDMVKFIAESDPQKVPKLIPILIEASDVPYRKKFLDVYKEEEQAQQQQQQQMAEMMQQRDQQQQEVEQQNNQIKQMKDVASIKKTEVDMDAKKAAAGHSIAKAHQIISGMVQGVQPTPDGGDFNTDSLQQ